MNRKTIWNSFCTLLLREIDRFMRIWIQTLVPPIITISLYFLIFGALIGPRIGTMGGFDYIQFMVPGLVIMSIISNTYANVSSSFFGMKFMRLIEDLLVTPTPNWVILCGFVAGGVVRGLMVGVLVMVTALFYTEVSIDNIGLTLAVGVLASVIFALAGFLNGLFANSFDDISVIPTFVLTPLIYLGGIFYSVDLLPDIWRNISYINPILYIVNAFRYGVLGISDIPVGTSIAALLVGVALLFSFSLWMLNRGTGIRQ
ncbi:MAG: ABC transporter permease [Gammaproteobacteria bacterium AqS3]|nr:ABC transporter permease [Gammaproteobacteria bacterium AqS3]